MISAPDVSAPDVNGSGNRSLAPRHAATLPGYEGLVELRPHNYKPRSHPWSGAPAPGERTRRQGWEVDGLFGRLRHIAVGHLQGQIYPDPRRKSAPAPVKGPGPTMAA
jgi:hypothetical protein